MGQTNSDMLQKMSIACSDLYAILVVGLTSGGFFFFRAPRIRDLYAHAKSISLAQDSSQVNISQGGYVKSTLKVTILNAHMDLQPA